MSAPNLIYRYRGITRQLSKISIALAVLYGAIGVLTFALTQSVSFSSLFFIFAFLGLSQLHRRLGTTEIVLGEDGVNFRNCAREFHIPYSEIARVDSGSMPYMGGWTRIRAKNGTTFRVTVVLEGIGSFVKELKQNVDAHNMSHVYDRRRLFRFLKTATYCEQSWSRLGRTALPFLFAISALPILLWFFVGTAALVPLLAGLTAFTWSEFVFARHVSRVSDEAEFTTPARDLHLENHTTVVAALACMLVGACTLLVMLG